MDYFNNLINGSSMMNFGLYEVIFACLAPLPLSLAMTLVYNKTQNKKAGNAEFSQSLIMFGSLISVLVMVIGNNLARAFGLFGVLTIIRFRTPVKSTLDAIFMFWSLTIGMAIGSGHLLVAIIITIFNGVLLLFFHRFKAFQKLKGQSLIRVVFSWDDFSKNSKSVHDLVFTQFKDATKIAQYASGNDQFIDVYQVEYHELEDLKKVIDSIKDLPGVRQCLFHQHVTPGLLGGE